MDTPPYRELEKEHKDLREKSKEIVDDLNELYDRYEEWDELGDFDKDTPSSMLCEIKQIINKMEKIK